jgi:hypothetical protein
VHDWYDPASLNEEMWLGAAYYNQETLLHFGYKYQSVRGLCVVAEVSSGDCRNV